MAAKTRTYSGSSAPGPPAEHVGRTFVPVTQGTLNFPEREHAHLRLARELPAGARVFRASGYPRPAKYPDQPAHAEKLKRDLAQLRAIHAKRTSVLGVDPENVAVLEFNTAPEDSALRAAGLRILDWFPDRVVVAAPGDPRLGGLAKRLELYQSGPREAPLPPADEVVSPVEEGAGSPELRARTAPHQALFDRIEAVRSLSVDEILTRAAAALIEGAAEGAVFLLDVQCWCPEDAGEARERHDATAHAVVAGGGRVLDKSLRHRSGLSLLRIEAGPGLARDLAAVPHVRRIDRIPRPILSHLETAGGGQERLPVVLSPLADAPLIAVVDSGVQSGHPLIGPAFAGSTATAGLDPESDGDGHGTFVASLALYGSLESHIGGDEPIRAVGRLVSVRVLDDSAEFPNAELWENHLLDALGSAVEQGARIINLSLGDPRRPYTPDRPTPLAAAIDGFVREHGVVVVISTGNMPLVLHDLESHTTDYTRRLLDEGDGGVLDPATSALALTVGALGGDEEQGTRSARESVDVLPVGGADLPSPLTRTGPGAARMVKPEVSAPGGHAALTGFDDHPRETPATSVVGADGRNPGKLFAIGAGTSFAAPLVTHAAAQVLAADPALSSRAVRALVLSSVRPLGGFLEPPGAATADRERRLVGYGRPRGPFAAHSTDHRAVLLAEAEIPVDDVHLYRVPIPRSFFLTGGWRRESIALAYDPQTRSTRLDYLSTRMQVQVYVGPTVDQVADAYLADRQAPPQRPGDETEAGDPTDDQAVSGPASLSPYKLDLQPSDKIRSRGAHIFATSERKHRRRIEDGADYIIAVQNINRWETAETRQPYALAVVLERDRDHDPIYAQLQVALEVRLPVEVQI